MRSYGWTLIQYDCVHIERHSTQTEGQPREDTVRKRPSARQGERTEKRADLVCTSISAFWLPES